MTYAIETNRLTKNYGAVRAVDSVSLRVDHGEIYGFLGLNGAGKTTTIRVLLGMIRPSAGSVSLRYGKDSRQMATVPDSHACSRRSLIPPPPAVLRMFACQADRDLPVTPDSLPACCNRPGRAPAPN